MPKKNMTPEERKAFGDKMKAAREAKKATAAEKPATVEIGQDQLQALMERLNKLESNKTETSNGSAQINNLGRAVGVMQKYSVDPADYANPIPELMAVKELERFAFKENYYMTWDVEQTQYETKYGTSFSEPRFQLRLYKRLYDEDGTPMVKVDNTGKPVLDAQGKEQFRAYLVKQAFFFEDPAASMKEALALGIPVTNANSKDFLEKMRKLRYRQWLVEIFNRPKTSSTSRKEQMVIGSSIVQVESYSTAA